MHDTRKKVIKDESYLRIGFRRVYHTISHLKNYRNLALFIIAYFFYIEGVNTVIYFSGNYASTTLNFGFSELIIFFLVVQVTAILGSVIFGLLADSIGSKRSIILSLIVWIITILIAFMTGDPQSLIILNLSELSGLETELLLKYSFYFVGLLAGSVMGATQSASRSLMTKLTPFEKRTEFFGFYSFFGKSSAILGPLVFGAVSYILGSQRFAVLSLVIFFTAGLLVLGKVKDPDLSAGSIK